MREKIMYKKGLVAVSSLILLLSLSAIVYAQIGEIAGHLNFYVPVGGSNSLPFTIANGGSSPLHFQLQPVAITAVANRTTPIVVVSPENGTIPPYSQFTLNVTATVPAKNNSVGFLFWQTIPKGEGWSGSIEVVAVSNSSGTGGANIEAGVVKIFTVAPYTVPPGALVYAGIAALVVIAIGIIFYFAVYKKRYAAYRPSKRAAAGRAKALKRAKALRRGKAAKSSTRRRAGKRAAKRRPRKRARKRR